MYLYINNEHLGIRKTEMNKSKHTLPKGGYDSSNVVGLKGQIMNLSHAQIAINSSSGGQA